MSKKVSTSVVIKKEIKKVFDVSIPLPEGLITNKVIRDQFFDFMSKSSVIPKQYLRSIWKLIENQTIIPVNVKKKGFLGFLNNLLKKSTCVPFSYDDGTLAFYSGASNRIYVLVDNILKFHKTDTDYIARTVVHELQHMQCHNFPSGFYQVHKSLIDSFYYNLFDILAAHKLTVNEKSSELFGRFLLYMFDDLFSCAGATITESDFDSYRDKAAAAYMDKNMKVPQIGMNIANALSDCAMSMIDGKFFDNASRDSKSIERYLYMAIGYTYRKIGMDPNKLKSFFGQECIVPSEIVAMLPAIKITPSLFAFVDKL